MQPQQTTDATDALGTSLDAPTVARFLTANPEFFDQHRDVLPRLRIPHASGRAVSLVERQVSALRGQCASLESSLRELIGVARANERLQGQLHALVREIISAPSLEIVVGATRRSLSETFGADAVHVLLRRPPDIDVGTPDGTAVERSPADPSSGAGYLRVGADDARLARFDELFEAGGTRCGLPTARQLEALAGADHADIGSAALIPLIHEGPIGVVMLTSRDESRFAAGKGVVFLDQLGEVLSRRMHALERPVERPVERPIEQPVERLAGRAVDQPAGRTGS